jgi:hypothetical protein
MCWTTDRIQASLRLSIDGATVICRASLLAACALDFLRPAHGTYAVRVMVAPCWGHVTAAWWTHSFTCVSRLPGDLTHTVDLGRFSSYVYVRRSYDHRLDDGRAISNRELANQQALSADEKNPRDSSSLLYNRTASGGPRKARASCACMERLLTCHPF